MELVTCKATIIAFYIIIANENIRFDHFEILQIGCVDNDSQYIVRWIKQQIIHQ